MPRHRTHAQQSFDSHKSLSGTFRYAVALRSYSIVTTGTHLARPAGYYDSGGVNASPPPPPSNRKISLFTTVSHKRSVPVAKAAILTTTMLQQQQQQSTQQLAAGVGGQPSRKMTPSAQRNAERRRSVVGPSGGVALSASQRRDSMSLIADLLAATSLGGTKKIQQQSFLESAAAERALKFACLTSLVTVCINTPATFQLLPAFRWPVLVADALVVGVLTAEAMLRTRRQRFYSNADYVRRRWDQFDFLILVFHWLSLIFYVYELVARRFTVLGLVYRNSFGTIRCVRPMICIKLIRLMIKFKLPRNRIQQLLRRSSSQVQNVTVFFVFFMAFYALMGTQLFSHMNYHCVVPGTDPYNVTVNDLAVPDTMCSPEGAGGYECPGETYCLKVDLSAKSRGFYGMFDDFGASVFTVYLAASEEGWVYVLYDCIDSFPSHIAFIYFVTLIFFLAWLVKNVFIAVITETFAEIRVQFSEMWQKKDATADDGFKQRLEKTEDGGWRLVRLDRDNKNFGARVRKFQAILRSTGFQCVLVILVLANAAVHATFIHRHDASDDRRRWRYYYVECGFTLLFNVECAMKIACYGLAAYLKRNIFRFELILCVGSSLNVVTFFYERNVFTYFQLFRIFRLIKASPMLEDFVYKIFSPGKKLGGLVIFTVTFVTIASAVSLQLFCAVPQLHHFQTFPQAFMSMFQIITQEGWTEFVVDVLRMVDDRMVPFVAIYFVAYHLFVTLILLSLFVAVILDNLEMDEELKKIKQLKAKEAISCMRTTLPWRLRVFDKFPTRPQMVRLRQRSEGALSRTSGTGGGGGAFGEFPMPRLRDSFAVQFVQDGDEFAIHYPLNHRLINGDESVGRKILLRGVEPKLRHHGIKTPRLLARHVGPLSIRASIYALIRSTMKSSTQRRGDVQSRSKSIGFFEKILNAENGDVATGAGSAGRSTATAADASDIEDSAARAANGGGAWRFGGTKVNQLQIDFRILQQKRQIAEMTRNRIEEDMRENHPYFDRPLFVVGRDSRLRKFCFQFVHARYSADGLTSEAAAASVVNGTKTNVAKRYKQIHELIGLMPYLDWAMVVFTLVSCVSMLFESPWPTTGENLVMNNIYLQIPDYLFVLAMSVELAAKVVSGGLFFTPHALVRDAGGIMTIFIYFTSLIFLATMPRHVEINSGAQLLMICRAMRPLRIYTLVPHIRRVVVELIRGFKEILMVTILLIIILFIFASFGVQSVGGKLAACNDISVNSRENCTGVFWQKIFVTRMEVHGKNTDDLHPKVLVPRVWTNPRNFDFDHIGNAMLALFETLSYKGWNVIRDILWARQGPWAVVFIHIFVFIGCMIGMTLFVGVVIANYTENRGTALLTVDQRRWYDLKARLKMAQPLHVPPKPSTDSRLRASLYQFTVSERFNMIFTVLVVLNSCTLIIPWNIDEELKEPGRLYIFTTGSAVINCVFALKILLKVSAFTVTGFWQSRQNRIDLLITATGILWVVTHFFIALPAGGGATRLKRFTYTFGYVVVVLRFFTLASRNSTLKMLMLTVVMSMFRSFFIIMTMALLMLFYAYTGVILFGMVKYGQAVSKHVNFRSGSDALVVLFRSITGEDWNDIMHDSSRSAPFCYWRPGINYWESDCGNFYGAIIYFCSFYLIITYIVRNLLVAIIMENFSLFYSSEEDALLSYADIRNFQLIWNLVDVEQKGAIPVHRVKFLFRLLKGRLEMDPSKDRLLFKHMCYEMEKLRNGDDVSFHDVLYMLSYRSVDIRKSLQLEELLQREELEHVIEEEVAKQTIKLWLEFCLKKMRKVSRKESTAAVFQLASLRGMFGFEPPVGAAAKLPVILSAQNILAATITAVDSISGPPSDNEDGTVDPVTTIDEPPTIIAANSGDLSSDGDAKPISPTSPNLRNRSLGAVATSNSYGEDSVHLSPSNTMTATAQRVRNLGDSSASSSSDAAPTHLKAPPVSPAVMTAVTTIAVQSPTIGHIAVSSPCQLSQFSSLTPSESFDTTTAPAAIPTIPWRGGASPLAIQRVPSAAAALAIVTCGRGQSSKSLQLNYMAEPATENHLSPTISPPLPQRRQLSTLMPDSYQPPVCKISGVIQPPSLNSLSGLVAAASSSPSSASENTTSQFLLQQSQLLQRTHNVQRHAAAVEKLKGWWRTAADADELSPL